MTCEVAVMNTRGIALAADSAVTLGDSEKIYHNAEKLLQLVPGAPVGIMIFGGADLVNVPWETIVAGYQKYLGERRFDNLHEYLDDLVAFIEQERVMFPEAVQKRHFAEIVRKLWDALYAQPWKEQMAKSRKGRAPEPCGLLRHLIAEDHPVWAHYPRLKHVDEGFIDQVLSEYATSLDEVEQKLFEGRELPDDIRADLRTTLRLFLSTASFLGNEYSGVVIAGMGEAEAFPGALVCKVGPMVKNRLRFHVFDHDKITHTETATIMPFAQRETIDMIIEGIHPDLAEALPKLLDASLKEHGAAKLPAKRVETIHDKFQKALRKEIRDKHSGPFMSAVSALPRHDLAAMAEALVNLTAFRAHASADVRETVAGPIDVAVLSKGEGFVWVKRKKCGTT